MSVWGENRPTLTNPLWAGGLQGRVLGMAKIPVFIIWPYLKTSQFTSWEEAKCKPNLYAIQTQVDCRQKCLCFWKCAFCKSNEFGTQQEVLSTILKDLKKCNHGIGQRTPLLWMRQNGLRPGALGPRASGCQWLEVLGGHCFMACPGIGTSGPDVCTYLSEGRKSGRWVEVFNG